MNTLRCTKCQSTLKSTAKFCHICGTPVSLPRPTTTPPQQQMQAQPLQFVRVREQSQGAYSIQIPKGWQYSATIQLYPDGNAVSVWQTQDPSHTVHISSPGTFYNFQEPVVAFTGQMLPNYRMMSYMPAKAFIQRGLLSQLRLMYPSMQVEHITEHPECITDMVHAYASTGQNPALAQFSIASVQFTFTRDGKQYRQEMYVTILRLPALHQWGACITGQLCTLDDQFAQYQPVLTTISKSFQWNQQWIQVHNANNQRLAAQIMQQAQLRIQQSQMQALQMQRQSIMDIGNMTHASQARQMASQEQQFHAMDNIIAGNIDLRDPNGQVYNVTNDFQPRHWIDGLGQVHGGNWNAQPGLNWTPLEPTGE